MNTQKSQLNPNREIADLLRRVRDLLGGPQRNGANLAQVKESHSYTAGGLEIDPWDPAAARWSLQGALAKFSMPIVTPEAGKPWNPALAAMGVRAEGHFDEAYNFLYAAAVMHGPFTPSGINNQGWDAARDLLDLAITLCENHAAVLPMLSLPVDRAPSPELRMRIERLAQGRGLANLPVVG
jgi:hypothetical protein